MLLHMNSAWRACLVSSELGVQRNVYGIEIGWPASWRQALERGEKSALPTMGQLVEPFCSTILTQAGSRPFVCRGTIVRKIDGFSRRPDNPKSREDPGATRTARSGRPAEYQDEALFSSALPQDGCSREYGVCHAIAPLSFLISAAFRALFTSHDHKNENLQRGPGAARDRFRRVEQAFGYRIILFSSSCAACWLLPPSLAPWRWRPR